MNQLHYRADIDGLRAIAVLSVLFFHTNVPGFSGGFVGVDIFFVISGFLITTIILKEIQEEHFSIARFYERRIRRIFPALFPVMLCTLAVAAYLFDQNAFKAFGQSVTATTLFSSNMLFWHEAGYFAAPSLQKPLLHTWSLAVEEQFYIVFPLALMIIHRYLNKQYVHWIVAAFVLSLGASIWGILHAPAATFYLVPTRAWELLAGSIVALGVVPTPSSVWMKNLLSLTGSGFIIYSVSCYTEMTLFPGYNAIVPVLGATLIIHHNTGGEGTSLVGKILSIKPLVFIGLISYSLYLWHWPLVAFAKYLLFRPLHGYESLAIIVASLVLAALSWKYIEQPFRAKQPLLPERKKLFAIASIVMIFASGIGGFIHVRNGMVERFPEAERAMMKQFEWDWCDAYGKLEQDAYNIQPGRCGAKNRDGNFLLWGDSHAMALIPGIDVYAKKHGISGYITTHSLCPPLLSTDIIDVIQYDEARFNNNVIDFITQHPEISTVILAGSWTTYFDDNKLSKSHGNASILFKLGIDKTIQTLLKMHRNIVLVCDIPSIKNYDGVRIIYLSKRFPHIYKLADMISIPNRKEYDILNKEANNLFDEIATTSSKITVIHPENLLFQNNQHCMLIEKGQPLYKDGNHLSTAGSHFIAPVFDDVFKRMAESQ